jgi:diguanylate cyclase (GGDEF)-like protein
MWWSSIGYVNRQPKLLLGAVGLLTVLLVGFLDYLTGTRVTFVLFYLFPVSLVAWFSGRRIGILLAVIAGIIWSMSNELALQTPWNALSLYWNTIMRAGAFLVVSYSLSTLKSALEYQSSLARTDSLTKAANRRAFLEMAVQEIDRSRRYKHPFTLAYIDADNFKRVNDRLGHQAGDAALRTIANTLKQTVRSSDYVARLGGDEFSVLMPETPYECAEVVLRRIQERLNSEMRANKWRVTFSIGAISFVDPPDTADELIRMADNLMYSVKGSGKNAIRHELSGNFASTPGAKAV